MKKLTTKLSFLLLACGVLAVTSCKKDDAEIEVVVEVPATYDFANADYTTSTQLIKMSTELNSYLGTATTTTITAAKANDYFDNKNAVFTDVSLNTSGINLAARTADADLFRNYFDAQAVNSTRNTIAAANGAAGFYPNGTGKRLVGAQGLEYNQAVVKGMMGALYYKEAIKLLSNIPNDDNKTLVNGATVMQRHWDEAFGLLGVPKDYDPAKTYVNTDANRPLLWGGYLAERGKPILAGTTIFEAFRKGRAAINVKNTKVVAEQIAIITDKWEQLAAAAAYEYVTAPTRSANVGNLGSQLHALSEGFGFIYTLGFRPSTSKLTAADYKILSATLNTNFYTLINEAGFTKLVQAQTILKTTYNLNY